MQHTVYWLYSGKGKRPKNHGYIGITANLEMRILQHQRLNERHRVLKVPKEFNWRVLFIGTKKQCLELEKRLRPRSNIGWNHGPGGVANSASGVPKSTEHREKIRLASIARWAKKGAREKQSIAVKKGLREIDRSGANNAMWGKHMSEEAKEKVRQKIIERGGVWGRNNPNYKDGSFIED